MERLLNNPHLQSEHTPDVASSSTVPFSSDQLIPSDRSAMLVDHVFGNAAAAPPARTPNKDTDLFDMIYKRFDTDTKQVTIPASFSVPLSSPDTTPILCGRPSASVKFDYATCSCGVFAFFQWFITRRCPRSSLFRTYALSHTIRFAHQFVRDIDLVPEHIDHAYTEFYRKSTLRAYLHDEELFASMTPADQNTIKSFDKDVLADLADRLVIPALQVEARSLDFFATAVMSSMCWFPRVRPTASETELASKPVVDIAAGGKGHVVCGAKPRRVTLRASLYNPLVERFLSVAAKHRRGTSVKTNALVKRFGRKNRRDTPPRALLSKVFAIMSGVPNFALAYIMDCQNAAMFWKQTVHQMPTPCFIETLHFICFGKTRCYKHRVNGVYCSNYTHFRKNQRATNIQLSDVVLALPSHIYHTRGTWEYEKEVILARARGSIAAASAMPSSSSEQAKKIELPGFPVPDPMPPLDIEKLHNDSLQRHADEIVSEENNAEKNAEAEERARKEAVKRDLIKQAEGIAVKDRSATPAFRHSAVTREEKVEFAANAALDAGVMISYITGSAARRTSHTIKLDNNFYAHFTSAATGGSLTLSKFEEIEKSFRRTVDNYRQRKARANKK